MDRRTVVGWLLALPFMGGAGAVLLRSRGSPAERREALRALVDVLLPADDAPGALAIGADAFVLAELSKPCFSLFAREVDTGLAALDRAAAEKHGAGGFAELDPGERDALLREAGDAVGPRFVQIVLTLTIEGVLADPMHGGNRDGAGWRLVGYVPGHPRGAHGG